jgi:lipopolysaccharide/colanic/teichoic acid biosynthesis glycosyltransferase
MDLALGTAMGLLALPLVLCAVLAVWTLDGRPIFHRSTRVGRGGVPFALWKLRTLRPDPTAPDRASGGHLAARQTCTGPFLRRTRIDELPQLWSVLRGEMALVGVRPPLPAHVALQPSAYAALLQAPPGLTGLATLRLHGIEGQRLARARTVEETEAVYAGRILPLKLRLDRMHARRRSVALDLWILARTLVAVARMALARPDAGPVDACGRRTGAGRGADWGADRSPGRLPGPLAGPEGQAFPSDAVVRTIIGKAPKAAAPLAWTTVPVRPHAPGPAAVGR